MKKILLLLFFTCLCVNTFSQTYFQKITTGELVNYINVNNQSAWGDYDNDGYLDLVISSYNDNSPSTTYPILLFHNNGDGTFTRITTGPIATYMGRTSGVTWGDYDNDGKLDLFVSVQQNFDNILFHNEGNGNFTQVTSGPWVGDGGESRACAWCDYDRDGWLDLFVCNQNDQNNFLYHNNGNGTFTKITTGAIVNDGGWSRGCMWGDYDNDGWPDLFVSNYQGERDFLYHNNGNGTFTKIQNGPEVNDNDWGSTAAWADYDNDGYLDLFVTNNNSTNKLYHNNGDGAFTITNTSLSNEVNFAYAANWGDYDNDGWLDMFVPLINGNNELYRNNGNSSFTKIQNEPMVLEGGLSVGGVWGDYNNDGKLDLFVTNTATPGKNYLYKNIGPTGNYIICKLHGCQSNKAGIGARVKIKAGSLSEIREITAGNGSENMLWPHFGLGNHTTIDSLIVYWPYGNSSRRQVLTNVAANQIITIDECLIGIISNEIPVKFELKQNYPNPFNPNTQIEYSLLKTSNVILTVFDISGKKVQTLINEKEAQGTYRVEFDGTNLASGVYFYKIETESFSTLKKMVLIK